MTHIIRQPCCKDATCVSVCPVDCIHPTPNEPGYARSEMLYIDPATCIDCGACIEVCPVDAIVLDEELAPEDEVYRELNAAYFDEEQDVLGALTAGPAVTEARTEETAPLRVAIVGSGPAACYAADELLSEPGLDVEVSMFERLPAPWGLVRYGVAPDHQETKSITKLFQTVVGRRGFALYLNVEVGKDITHRELLDHHHAVIYAVGAPNDRRLGIPGEDLAGSHSATDFVGWYNGHPDYADKIFDFSSERAVVIGNGNVALDVARVLTSDMETLARTDIADHALTALADSKVKEVVVVGRRGPAQAAFTTPELIGLGHLRGIDVTVDKDESGIAELLAGAGTVPAGAAAATLVDAPGLSGALSAVRNRVLMEYAGRGTTAGNRRITLSFLRSPLQLLGMERVEGIREKNYLTV